jgi:hypothetical protein
MSSTSIATDIKSAADPPLPASRTSDDGKMPASPTNGAVEAFNPGWRFYLAFLSLTTITLMVALDATSLSVALPIMAKALGGSSIQAFWSGTSFLLTSTVFQPVLGSFSEIFGRKPMLFVSLALFGAGAIIAALAHDFDMILVGRSIQGVGGGGVITLTEIVVTDLVPLRIRGQWFSFVTSAWALGKLQTLPAVRPGSDCDRNRYGAAPGRWLLAKRELALDLLDQLALHWRRWRHDRSVPEPQQAHERVFGEVARSGLGRDRPLHRLADGLPDPADVGRRHVRVELVADAGPTDRLRVRARRLCGLRGVAGGQGTGAADPVRGDEVAHGHCYVLWDLLP